MCVGWAKKRDQAIAKVLVYLEVKWRKKIEERTQKTYTIHKNGCYNNHVEIMRVLQTFMCAHIKRQLSVIEKETNSIKKCGSNVANKRVCWERQRKRAEEKKQIRILLCSAFTILYWHVNTKYWIEKFLTISFFVFSCTTWSKKIIFFSLYCDHFAFSSTFLKQFLFPFLMTFFVFDYYYIICNFFYIEHFNNMETMAISYEQLIR